MRRKHLPPLVAASVLAALAPGLAAVPAHASPGPATAAAATPGAAPAAASAAPSPVATTALPASYTRQKLDWRRCGADTPAALQCASFKVPLDYRRPGGRKIEIVASRLRSTDPGKRRGVMLSNPGGPGGPGITVPLRLAEVYPKSVLDRYDLIGLDPRGIGRSTPVSCGLAKDEQSLMRPLRTFDANVAWAKRVADKCRAKSGDLLPHITTRNTARDMDVLRALLGERRISYFGISYGTALGAVYTQMFPQRADRFVLDSAVDPDGMWREMFRSWGREAEPAFARWAKWTAERSATYGLGTTADEVTETFWGLVRRADREPIVVGGAPYSGADIRDALRAEFFTPRSGAEWVVVVKKAAAGEDTEIPPMPGPTDQTVSALWSVLCGDAAWPRDPRTYRANSIRDAARYPLHGDFASGIGPCAFWDAPVEPVTKVDNTVKALVVQNEWDSQTPLKAAQSMHRAMKGSRMVTVAGGEGHGVAGLNRCADGLAATYLATGKLPARDVTCRVDPQTGARSPLVADSGRPAPAAR
ncbi:alpha/beta hydrolase [Streptomyces sp. NPDC050504]|uniref:alpha/beta hydrolase n=1 Tax=Streptomyces sp. NPDC050504 TaxID=3365618 RepID=UPI0037A72FBD